MRIALERPSDLEEGRRARRAVSVTAADAAKIPQSAADYSADRSASRGTTGPLSHRGDPCNSFVARLLEPIDRSRQPPARPRRRRHDVCARVSGRRRTSVRLGSTKREELCLRANHTGSKDRSAQGLRPCAKRLKKTSLDGENLAAPAVPITTARKSSISGAVSETRRRASPWERDTMVIVYSATKGLAAMTLAIAHSRGWLDYEERVCAYWPEFAQEGKERITVRQLLAHQAGLFAFDEAVDRSVVADLDRLAIVLARQKPAWEPGTRQAYHAITLGLLRKRALAPHRSTPSQPGTVLPGRDRHAARPGPLHQAARGHPELPPGHDCPARLDRNSAGVPASSGARRDESALQDLTGAQGFRAAS